MCCCGSHGTSGLVPSKRVQRRSQGGPLGAYGQKRTLNPLQTTQSGAACAMQLVLARRAAQP